MSAEVSVVQGTVTIFAAWVGMFAHLLKKNLASGMGQTWGDLKRYVKLHLMTIILSLVLASMSAIAVIAVQHPEASIWAFLSAGATAGVTGDSFIEVARKHKEKKQ